MSGQPFPTFSRIHRAPVWLYRSIVGRWKPIVGTVLALAVVYSVATAVLGYRVSLELSRISAEGSPVEITELIEPPVPDSENAALVYEKVFEKIRPIEQSPLFEEFYRGDKIDKPFRRHHSQAWWQSVSDLYGKYEQAYIPLLVQAQSMSRYSFRTDWGQGIHAKLPHLARLRSLARVMCLRSSAMARTGDAQGAVDSLLSAVRLCKVISDATLIHAMVQIAVLRMCSDATSDVVGNCSLGYSQIRELEAALSGVDLDRTLLRAMKGERAVGIASYTATRTRASLQGTMLGIMSPLPKSLRVRPLYYADLYISPYRGASNNGGRASVVVGSTLGKKP